MNKRNRLLGNAALGGAALAFALLAAVGVYSRAPQVAPAKSLNEAIEQARARVREQFASKVPGLAIAAGRDGKMIWSETFGYADLEAKRNVLPETMFRIGSVSKPLTAAGLMQLVEQGKLDLDADVHKYVPDFPDKGYKITTRHLAGHIAGVRHYRGDEFMMNRPFATVRDGLTIFAGDPLLFAPGEKYSYSTYGWNLISAVMEGAAKQDFLSYMQKNVIDRLALKNTAADIAGKSNPQRAQFYDVKDGGGFVVTPAVDNSYKWAGGGFLSTAEDLVRFGMAHLHAGLLKQESLTALFTSQKLNDGKETGYGIGWSVGTDTSGHRIWSHTGGAAGGTSALVIHPDSGIVVAMISNCGSSPFSKNNREAIADLFSIASAIK